MGYSIIRYPFFMSPYGKGSYGSKVGRPKKSKAAVKKKKTTKKSKKM